MRWQLAENVVLILVILSDLSGEGTEEHMVGIQAYKQHILGMCIGGGGEDIWTSQSSPESVFDSGRSW